jgi:hypothetical protein
MNQHEQVSVVCILPSDTHTHTHTHTYIYIYKTAIISLNVINRQAFVMEAVFSVGYGLKA